VAPMDLRVTGCPWQGLYLYCEPLSTERSGASLPTTKTPVGGPKTQGQGHRAVLRASVTYRCSAGPQVPLTLSWVIFWIGQRFGMLGSWLKSSSDSTR